MKNPTYLTHDIQDHEAERFVTNPQYGETRGAAISATYEDIDLFHSHVHGNNSPPMCTSTGLDDVRTHIRQPKNNPSYLELLPKPASFDVDKSGDRHETKTPGDEYENMLPPRGTSDGEVLKKTLETETTTPKIGAGDEEGHYVLAF